MTKAPKVARLFADAGDDDLPVAALDVSHIGSQSPPKAAARAAITLDGKAKINLAIGQGGVGKTTLLRWVAERSLARDDGDPLALVTVDPVNRELAHYFPDA